MMMRAIEEPESAQALEPITDPPLIPKLLAELTIAEDPRAVAARAIPPGEGGPATAADRPDAEPPAGEPPTAPPPVEAPPPGLPEAPPPPAGDPPPPQAPITEPPSDAPVIQAAVAELEPVTALPESDYRALSAGSYLYTPSGPLWIAAVGKVVAGVQYYDVLTSDGRKLQLQEAYGEAVWKLQGESALLSTVRTPQLPLLIDRFELNGRYYVVTELEEESAED